MKNNFLILILFFLTLNIPATAQDNLSGELRFEININYPPLSVTKEKLNQAENLADLNKYYKPSWVREYISVEISAIHEGKLKKSVSKSNALDQEQKDIMLMADPGTGISVMVQYIPENTLPDNDVKEINFTFTVDPENQAVYSGGQQKLNQYIRDNAIDKIPVGGLSDNDLAIIKFTINEEGQITNAHIFESLYHMHKNDDIDELLLETICNMPRWKPAEYADGTKVKQEFALAVGNLESCVINFLNIRQDQ